LRIEGVPETAGDFEYFVSGTEGDENLEVIIRITIIPDPKTLWKNLESNKDDPYWKPDAIEQQFKTDELFLVGASKRGRSHAHNGTFRDDDFGLVFSEETGWYIGICCDGKGSGAFSRKGSQIAVTWLSNSLPALLKEQFSNELITQIQNDYQSVKIGTRDALWKSLVEASLKAAIEIESEASRQNHKASDYDTTLLVSVARRIGERWLVGAFAIGDGGIAIISKDFTHVLPLMKPDSGSAAGETKFLNTKEFTSEGISTRLHFDLFEDFDSLYLMSDGITDAKLPTENDLGNVEKWRAFVTQDISVSVELDPHNDQASKQLLDWLDFWVPGEHDDRTIVILKR
jgi:serine/threonine protein phosphatase PrpC